MVLGMRLGWNVVRMKFGENSPLASVRRFRVGRPCRGLFRRLALGGVGVNLMGMRCERLAAWLRLVDGTPCIGG